VYHAAAAVPAAASFDGVISELPPWVVDVFDTVGNTWTAGASPSGPLTSHPVGGAVVDQLIVLDQTLAPDGHGHPAPFRYDVAGDVWGPELTVTPSPLNGSWRSVSAVVIDGTVYAVFAKEVFSYTLALDY
jgi:hypothetical protein